MRKIDKIYDEKVWGKEESYNKKISLSFQPDCFSDFSNPPEFDLVFKKFTQDDKFRGMDVSRLWSVILNAKHVLSSVDGAIAELGVYKGHMSAVLSYYAEAYQRHMYMIDTFTGFSPEQFESNLDDSKKNAFRDTNVEYAKRIVGKYSGNRWLVGTFPDCINAELSEEKFAFVSLDCDLYEPIKSGLEFFWPRVVEGGEIFVHDYASGHWPGVKLAVDEFSKKLGLSGVILPDKSGTYVLTKRSGCQSERENEPVVDVELLQSASACDGTLFKSVKSATPTAAKLDQDIKPTVVDALRLPLKFDWASLILPLVLAAAIGVWVVFRAFDWPHAEDFLLVDWYRQFFLTGEISLGDVLLMKLGPHPVGLQALVTIILFELFGVNFNLLVGLNVTIAAICGLLLSIVLLSDCNGRVTKWFLPVLLMAVCLHPIQMNHLLWPFELGWFMVNLALVVNILLIEFRGEKAAPLVAVVCLLGTLSSGQGGFLWLLAGFHFLLIGGAGRYARAGIFFAAFIALIACFPRASEMSGLMEHGIGGLIVYFAQLFGGAFGVRGTQSTLLLGLLVLTCALGLSANSLICNHARRPAERVGLLLVLGSLLLTAGFTLARYKYGIAWAQDRFHAAPLMVPMLAGIVALAVHYIDVRKSFVSRSVAVAALVGIATSVAMAIPYATVRLDEQITSRGFGMAIVCNQQDGVYLEASANGLPDWEYPRLARNRTILANLCSDKLPATSRMLLKPPDLFIKLSTQDSSIAHGLSVLWGVYQIHQDLQRTFPIGQPDLGENLLIFASNNAKTGSGYEKSVLEPYSDLYIRLQDAQR